MCRLQLVSAQFSVIFFGVLTRPPFCHVQAVGALRLVSLFKYPDQPLPLPYPESEYTLVTLFGRFLSVL